MAFIVIGPWVSTSCTDEEEGLRNRVTADVDYYDGAFPLTAPTPQI